MESLEKYFLATAKKGVILSSKQLHEYSRKKNLKLNLKEIRHLRGKWKFTAMFTTPRPIAHYMTSSLPPRPGSVQIDFANFHHNSLAYKRANGGAIGLQVFF
jgi:hypothetical protein